MTCLLCFQITEDSIPLISDEGKHLNLSSLLFKYFRFCFDSEPVSGFLCRSCWKKLVEFHDFYIGIEAVYEQLNKNQITETLNVVVKEEKIEEVSVNFEPSFELNSNDSPYKCEPVYSEGIVSDFESTDRTSIAESKYEPCKRTQSESEKHQQRHVPKSGMKVQRKKRTKKMQLFKCKIRLCSEEFMTKEDLIAHKIVAHNRIQCTYCPDMKLVLDLNSHLKNIHGIIQKTICEHCGQVFQNNATFLSHVKGVHEVHEPLQCDICKDWFKSKDSIRSHMTYVHIQGSQTCQICGKISTNRKSLLKHQLIHIESRKDRYKCIVCGKGFRDNTKLKEHSYIHSGVTDAYECNFCGRHFRFGSSLSAHRMKIHPKEMAEVKNRLQWKRNSKFQI